MSIKTWWLRLTGAAVLEDKSEGNLPVFEPSAAMRPAVHKGTWLLLGGFLMALAWTAFAPLDEGIPAPGTVMVDTKRKTIQHLTGGLISKVLVREGQVVNAGDILMTLDDAQARADYETARHRYFSLRATESRLIAEQLGTSKLTFHPDVLAEKDDPLVAQHTQTQELLFASRRAALRSELESIQESIKAQKEAANGYIEQIEARKQQLDLFKQELEGTRDLVKEGYAPRNKQFELERLVSGQLATLSDLQSSLARARSSAAELGMRKIQREQEYRKEVDTQMAEVRRELNADQERFKSTRDALARTEIRAPVKGAVVGIATQTIGGVITPGTRIMDIVPADEPLLLEAHLPPHLVDRVKVGQLADVRFSNFLDTPQMVVEGHLDSLSADLLVDQATNIPYYLARVSVTREGLKMLGNRHLQPGMPAEIVIKTGERTLLEYLMHPLIRRLAQGMREP